LLKQRRCDPTKIIQLSGSLRYIMVTTVPDSNNPIQIEIFPQRLLNPETVQELIIELQGIEGIMRVILHGPRIASTVPSGPAKGTPNPHEARKSIKFGGEEIELGVQVGRIWLELEDEDGSITSKPLVKEFYRAASRSIKDYISVHVRRRLIMPNGA